MGEFIGSAHQAAPVKKLKISEPLDGFPSHIFDLAESLEHLDLSGTGLSSLPDNFGQLKRLKIAFFSNCNFTVFPKQLASCPELEMVAFRSNGLREIPENALPPRLRWLILTNNEIERLPNSIGKCPHLQKCMLSGNRLRTLPDEMAGCRNLGLLRLSANQIEILPSWLFAMPELSFLSFAGNPCSTVAIQRLNTADSLSSVPWTDINAQEVLGEGASGIISKGLWKADREYQEVAIKLFKGDVTSDGTPMDEMRACIMAGSHDNLIDPLGEIQGHPDKKGLVLQLIPPSYSTLGLPPSLQSCTRDCFASETALSFDQGLTILQGIASAAAHLHARAIAHGDLYAHNILFNEEGHALLGDFGAASIYADYAMEQLEVLAFAHLLQDISGLIERDSHHPVEQVSLANLKTLHEKCTLPDPSTRPTFVEIQQALASIIQSE
ncbi:hypothetical protein JX265_002166 [Neoarthrinium moseri]|uniref:Protein kinase domain-containing protein n=2 Tax=Neoarthrinium moseri TaxID=1658444 RepID=A0A9P9WUF5_9PEZI|nr:hypothetical protein JX265_002166 [Neoarthrinium moseri]